MVLSVYRSYIEVGSQQDKDLKLQVVQFHVDTQLIIVYRLYLVELIDNFL